MPSNTHLPCRLLAFTFLAMCASMASAADFAVTNTSNGGPGSLRQAIFSANSTPGADRIVFDIPGAGRHKIDVSQNFLPAITDTVTIDGYTQRDSRPNSHPVFDDAVILIQIDGGGQAPENSSPTGLTLNASGCVVRGLMITGFTFYSPDRGQFQRFGGYGIDIQRENCVVEGNFLGSDGSPQLQGQANRGAGVRVRASGARIGGNTPAARNVIGGARVFTSGFGAGVLVDNSGIPTPALDGIVIAGNQIGGISAPPGFASAEGNDIGIAMGGATFTNTIIGGTDPASANFISGNQIGIRLGYDDTSPVRQAAATGVVIQGNLIGVQPDTVTSRQNQSVGIEVLGSNNLIGGFESGAANQIVADSVGVQVMVRSVAANRNRILSNLINGNERPIVLVTDSPTTNDFGDRDTGPNNLQNFPVITSAATTSGGAPSVPNGSIKGRLNSTPNTEFTIQFFRYNLEPKLLGSLVVTTDASGDAPFIFFFYDPAPDQSGSYYTATATDAEGNTSEFSPQSGPVQLANISTRGNVGTNDFVLIGGFIVQSNAPKKVAIRALGPSVNVPERRLADPFLELYDSSGTLLAKNDDWRSGQQQEVVDSGLAPASEVESALIATLPAGNYTAQVRGADGGTGTGIVEVYDLDPLSTRSGRLVNISTRAILYTQTDVLIGGFIVRGDTATRVIVRAIGPDVGGGLRGVPDPTLELRDSNGDLIAANDDWRQQQEAEITATGLAPKNDRNSAIVAPLAPGAYTALLRGKDPNGGVALVEFYDLKN